METDGHEDVTYHWLPTFSLPAAFIALMHHLYKLVKTVVNFLNPLEFRSDNHESNFERLGIARFCDFVTELLF